MTDVLTPVQAHFRKADDAWPISRGVGLIIGIWLAVGLWAAVLGAAVAALGLVS